jgi:hypothetical protein
MFRYTFSQETEGAVDKVIISFEAVTMNDVMSRFEDFLRGCGFFIDGMVDITPMEKITSEFEDKITKQTENQ